MYIAHIDYALLLILALNFLFLILYEMKMDCVPGQMVVGLYKIIMCN